MSDTRAAATELGYIFTFLLGVLLMSMFSVWAWDIETNRLRWNQEAIQANMDDIAAAVEQQMRPVASEGTSPTRKKLLGDPPRPMSRCFGWNFTRQNSSSSMKGVRST